MSLLTKIRRTKDNQLERYNAGRVNPNDTSFMLWVKQKMGYLDLMSKRKFYDPHNVLQWALPVAGQDDNNTSISTSDWYGLKFSLEQIRGDLARSAQIDGYDMWSFFCGVEGVYSVGVNIKFEYEDQDAADTFILEMPMLIEPTLKLAINGNKLIEPIARCNGMLEDTITPKLTFYLHGTQDVYLRAGDRLNCYLNAMGFATPEAKVFTTYGYIYCNFQTKKSRRITEQYTGEEL